MAEVTLEVARREQSGKGVARKLRADGKIPAVVYGGHREAVPIVVDRSRMRCSPAAPVGAERRPGTQHDLSNEQVSVGQTRVWKPGVRSPHEQKRSDNHRSCSASHAAAG